MTRGERNNNPGNLRDFGIAWEGLADPPHDAEGYCRFVDALHGLRACARDLYTTWRDGRCTVALIIGKYAPPAENATKAYVADIAGRLGVAADATIFLNDPETLRRFTAGVVSHENGEDAYDQATLAEAVRLALAG